MVLQQSVPLCYEAARVPSDLQKQWLQVGFPAVLFCITLTLTEQDISSISLGFCPVVREQCLKFFSQTN